jgi:hypothetical protein
MGISYYYSYAPKYLKSALLSKGYSASQKMTPVSPFPRLFRCPDGQKYMAKTGAAKRAGWPFKKGLKHRIFTIQL